MSKLGNKESDCEDSYSSRSRSFKFAIADGASSSIFSDVWAKALTDMTVNGRYNLLGDPESFMPDLVQRSRQKWYNEIDWNNMPWYLKNKSIIGSHSTLLALQLKQRKDRYFYSSFAVGDSCLFHWEGGDDYSSYPLTSPDEFGSTPDLVWSGKGFPMPIEYRLNVPRIERYSGTLLRGGTLFLATDAVSKWLMEYGMFQEVLELLDSKRGMAEFISGEIDSKRMRNDDITVVSLTLQ